ncbi:MAG TPA: AMP-binding protein [Puia sp.]|nr:AMP-binding protein [Puia sp.]
MTLPVQENIIVIRLKHHAVLQEEKPALVLLEEGERVKKVWGYSDLLGAVVKTAGLLCQFRLTGKRVLLFYQEVPDFLIAFLACNFVGAIPIPMPFARSGKQLARLRNIVDDAKASALLCSPDFIPQWEIDDGRYLPEIIPVSPGDKNLEDPGDSCAAYNEIAFIQYTSGSTGFPKGVIVTNENLRANQEMIQRAFYCNIDSVILSWLPFHHDMGLIGNLLHCLYIGCTCIVMSPFDFIQRPQRWVEAIARYRVTHSGGPNFAFDLCAEKTSDELAGTLDLSCWEVAYNGSEPVQADTLNRFSGHFFNAGFRPSVFYPCYGLAEATLFVTGAKVQGSTPALSFTGATGKVLVSSGMPVDGIAVSILSSDGQVSMRDGEVGEICLEGASVSGGYFDKDDPDLYHTVEGHRLLRTGDLGFVREKQLFVNGRMKEVIIVRGKNLYPADIEQVITRCHPALELNGAVIFRLDRADGELVIVAELKREQVRKADMRAVISAIEAIVKGEFAVVPIDIVLTTPLGIPRTTSGKLQRLRCRDLYRQDQIQTVARKGKSDIDTDASSGDGHAEMLAREVIAAPGYECIRKYLVYQILARTGVVPDLRKGGRLELTDLGLDSLRGMELINTINKQLQINLDVATVLRDNSFEGLITLLENVLWLKTGDSSGREIVI